jgi:GT2 family glycosyltransferase/glycosyltransferase involved in cell wall biosynthesis
VGNPGYVKHRRKLVMLTWVLPSEPADNAGGRFVNWVVDVLSERNEVLLLVPDSPSARRARATGRVPSHLLLGGGQRPVFVGLDRMLAKLLPFVMPVHVPWRFTRQLLRDPAARAEIRSADLIDLQWQEQGTLIPLLRLLNPNARIVCTFHDVLSQRFDRSRASATTMSRRIRWAWAAAQARQTERQIVRRADAVVVLSEKDRRLLPSAGGVVHVVTPPLGKGSETSDRSGPRAAELLFVSFLARWENEEGLLWFLSKVWPQVKKSVPDARFRIAGDGIRTTVREAADLDGVELLGFVADLEPLYEQASVVVVPIRLGAGVKFKVVDALVAGVPVITTNVGAEGIGESSWFAGVHDKAEDFAQAVIGVLANPAAATARSAKIREQVLDEYGTDQFEKSLSRVYSYPTPWGSEENEGQSADSSTNSNNSVVFRQSRVSEEEFDVSVVIPVYNGASSLSEQLAALAVQADDIPFEVVISDNGSTDSTREVAINWAGRFASLVIVDSSQNQGVSHARNKGALVASGKKILICDADDVVGPAWVAALAAGLDQYDSVGGAARLDRINPEAVIRGQAHVATGLAQTFGFLPYALGASLGVRRDVLLAIGGFDLSFQKGHDEVDFAWRLQLAGYTLGWCPEAVVDYRQRSDSYGAARQSFNYAKSSVLLWCRHSESNPLTPISFSGSLRNLAVQLSRSYKIATSTERREYAKDLGWTAGVVAGHLNYRKIGSVPRPLLMELANWHRQS